MVAGWGFWEPNFLDELIDEWFLRDWGDIYKCYFIVDVVETYPEGKQCVRDRYFKECELVGLFTKKEACEEALRKGYTHDGHPEIGEYIEARAMKHIDEDLRKEDYKMIDGEDNDDDEDEDVDDEDEGMYDDV